jgi:uncharacterized protein YndB with AHSA1/START domain
MPVKVDESGRRYVQSEVEVPGTPNEVWQAIATGPGLSSWFVPAEFETGPDGVPERVTLHFGPGASMDSRSVVTAWDPPHRFAAESRDDLGPDDPTVATEWVVEARAGGTCVVRVVHSWFADSDAWDEQWAGTEQGWRAFFRILRLYLTHFRGLGSSVFQLMGVAPDGASAPWDTLTGSLGLTGAVEGRRVATAAGAPSFSGVVERVGPEEHPELLIRLDEPAPGLAHLFALPMGGELYVPIRVFLYGERAAATAARAEPAWSAWLAGVFGPAEPGGGGPDPAR